jgi:hypothetical protein
MVWQLLRPFTWRNLMVSFPWSKRIEHQLGECSKGVYSSLVERLFLFLRELKTPFLNGYQW